MKNIGIIGSAVVAQALAKGFANLGHKVLMGSRSPEKLEEFISLFDDNMTSGSFRDAAAFGDIIVLAVKGTATESALQMAGLDNLNGKTIIDATNPIADAPPEDGVLNFFSGINRSLMEELQDKFPGAKFVKAFNSVASVSMVDPNFESKPTMFICGNDAMAKSEVSHICDQFGWEVEDMGTAKAARGIEPLCMLFCIPGFNENKWSHAFKLLKP